jgi:hypothetical protein
MLTSSFGFGKRVCPGRHFADYTLFIVVASLLSVFKIEKGDGVGGGPDAYPYTGLGIRYDAAVVHFSSVGLTLRPSPADFLFSRPNSFSCSILPRDKRAEELIVAESLAH